MIDLGSAMPRTEFNPSKYAVLDCNGVPLHKGCKVKFTTTTTYINTKSDTGTVESVSEHGYVSLRADSEWDKWDRRGGTNWYAGSTKDVHFSNSNYQYNGEFTGILLLRGKVGDPWEHGSYPVYIERILPPVTTRVTVSPLMAWRILTTDRLRGLFLSDRAKEILLLRANDGLSNVEIGKVVKINPKSVSRIIKQAHKIWSNYFKRFGIEPEKLGSWKK